MRNILITGANGYLGRHLVKNINGVVTADRSTFNDSKLLTNAVRHCDVIIHLIGRTDGSLSEQIEANLLTTSRLLDIINSLDKKPLLIFPSTFAIYQPQKKIITEMVTPAPRNLYGLTKLLAETCLIHSAKINDLKIIIFRLTGIYGGDMTGNDHSVVANFLKDDVINVVGNGNQERDLIHVDDVVDAFRKTCVIDLEPGQVEIINICTGIGTSIKDLSLMFDKTVVYKPKLLGREGRWIGSYQKARRLLKWKPKIGLLTGIKRCTLAC